MKFVTIVTLGFLDVGSLVPLERGRSRRRWSTGSRPDRRVDLELELHGRNLLGVSPFAWGSRFFAGSVGWPAPALFSDPTHPGMHTAFSSGCRISRPWLCQRRMVRRSRVVLVPTGTATGYYTGTPALRDLSNVRDISDAASMGGFRGDVHEACRTPCISRRQLRIGKHGLLGGVGVQQRLHSEWQPVRLQGPGPVRNDLLRGRE